MKTALIGSAVTAVLGIGGGHSFAQPALAPVSNGDATVAQPTTAPTTAPVVIDAATSAAVAKLVNADATERDTVQRELVAAAIDGQTLAAALRAAMSDPAHAADLDLHLRLDTLLVQAQERADVGPTRITLDVHDMPLPELLKEFNRQGRSNFGDPTNDLGGAEHVQKVTLKLDHATFWTAIKELQSAAKISVYPQGGGESPWRVMNRNSGAPGISGEESGAFLIMPGSANYQRSLAYSNGGSSNENFWFQFTVFGEPKLQLGVAQGMLTLDKVVDDHGNSLIGAQRSSNVSVNGNNGANIISCNLQLAYPKTNPGTRFAEISGTLRVLTARRTQTLATDDLMAEPQPLRITTADGGTLTVMPAPKPNPNVPNPQPQANADLSILAVIEGGDPLANDRISQLVSQMRVSDSNGRGYALSGMGQSRDASGRIEITIGYTRADLRRNRPGNNAAPAREADDQDAASKPKIKLQLTVPTSVRQIEVPFSMKDLKLP